MAPLDWVTGPDFFREEGGCNLSHRCKEHSSGESPRGQRVSSAAARKSHHSGGLFSREGAPILYFCAKNRLSLSRVSGIVYSTSHNFPAASTGGGRYLRGECRTGSLSQLHRCMSSPEVRQRRAW